MAKNITQTPKGVGRHARCMGYRRLQLRKAKQRR
nr:MAG TPA: hypothetical protein [Caudoviricetes sp.]